MIYRKIYRNNADLIREINVTIFYLNQQNYSKGLRSCARSIQMLDTAIPLLVDNSNELRELGSVVDIKNLIIMLQNIQTCQNEKDYILLTDILESALLPFLTSIQESIALAYEDYSKLLLNNGEKEVKLQYFQVEPTSQGIATLCKIDKDDRKIYFHSNVIPSKEALLLATKWYRNDRFHYIVYGLGLGYHVIELINISDSIMVDVYESSSEVIELARSYGVLSELEKSAQFILHYDPDFQKIAACDMDGEYTKFVAHYPSVRIITDARKREWFENYFTNYNAVSNQELTMLRSFVENQKIDAKSVDEILPSLKDKDVYVIAAGPSLDKNMNQLKNVSDNGVIISTGTVLKKLLANDIVPDYVVIIDANSPTLKQIEGIENCDVPLIFLSTAYYGTVAAYNADRYIACQHGYDKAQELAKKNGYRLYNTGGSVTTLCIDIALQAHCKRLICVGLDLAFTGGYDHASDTAQAKAVDDNAVIYRRVASVDGGYVNTSKGLDVFRLWIEKRIKDVNDIEIIDATEGGALIKGMKIMPLSECVG